MEECVYPCRPDIETEGTTQEAGIQNEDKKGEWRDRSNNSKLVNSEEVVTGVCSAGLHCLYTNACSLMNILDELRQRLSDIDIIAVSETWATEELSDAELSIDGYVLFRRDRKSDRFTKGGGVALSIYLSI